MKLASFRALIERHDTELPCQQPENDENLWFSHPGSAPCNEAKALCLECPIYWDCAEYALTEGIPEGVFGGLSGKDRRNLWKKRPGGRPTHFDDAIDSALPKFSRRSQDEARAS